MAKNKEKLKRIFYALATPEEKLAYEFKLLQERVYGIEASQPETPEKGEKGEPGKDGSPDTGEQIVEKINKLPVEPEKQVDFVHIKNFPWHLVKDKQGNDLIAWGNPLLTIDEVDGSPSVSQVTGITFPNGSVTDDGDGTVTVSLAGALSGTINEIAYFNSATTIASLPVATYPSLTELSYVKGVTSAIQTQLNAKLSITTAAATYVPYTGANANIDIGTFDFAASNVTMNNDANLTFYSDQGITQTGVIGMDGIGLYTFEDSGGLNGILDFNSIATSDKTFTFPDASGTLALISDLEDGYVPYTGATGDLDLGPNNLNFSAGGGLIFTSGMQFQSNNVNELELAGNNIATLSVASLTTDRTYNLPDRAGTFVLSGDTLTGDITATFDTDGSTATTLATVNANVGSFGSATQVGTFTVNAKGLITAASNTSIQIAESQVTNLVTDLGNKQPLDATLTAFAALTIAADSLTIGTGADAFSQTTFAANTFPAKASTGSLVAKTITDFGLSLVDDANASAARTTLGLVIGTDVQAYDADLTTWAGITPGTGVGTALAVNVGSAGAFVVNGGALGTPSSGTVTNLTGTASININGTVGATTPAAGTFTAAIANSFVPNSSTIPSDGMYLPAANTLGWAINSAAELKLTATALFPASNGGLNLGVPSTGEFTALYFAANGGINWDNGAQTLVAGSGQIALTAGQILLDTSTNASLFQRSITDGNTDREMVQFRRTNSAGAGADNIGARFAIYVETETEGTLENIGRFGAVATDATAGTIDSYVYMSAATNSAFTNFLYYTGASNLGLNTLTFGTSAVNVLGIKNGTEPTTSPADMVQLYSVDLSAGNATLGLRTETGVVTESVTSDRTLSVRINGTTYKICLKA